MDDDTYSQSVEKGGSMRVTGPRKRVGFSDSSEDEGTPKRRSSSALQKVFHEELVLQWIVSHPNMRVLIFSNAWFFFELLVRVQAHMFIHSIHLFF